MGKSSKDKRDAYYRLAKEQGWRARSAFKLLQLDEEFNLFHNVSRVVDLCAAPGSWSQVLSRVLIKGEKFGRAAWADELGLARQRAWETACPTVPLTPFYKLQQEKASEPGASVEDASEQAPEPRKPVKIVSIDLQPIAPLPGVTTMVADITHPPTLPRPNAALETEESHTVDLVVSDGAPDVTGLHDLDIYVQSQLLWAALNLALCVLRPGGTFVAKIFRAKDVDLIYEQMRVLFKDVVVAKPRSSRASSLEAFIVCRNLCPPPGFEASLEKPLGRPDRVLKRDAPKETTEYPVAISDPNDLDLTILDFGPESPDQTDGQARWIAPFLACGDLSAYDADATYELPKGHVSLDPVQPPVSPPYKKALELKRRLGGAEGKTKHVAKAKKDENGAQTVSSMDSSGSPHTTMAEDGTPQSKDVDQV